MNVNPICVGTQSNSLSDALLISSLPTRLGERQPGTRFVTLRSGFNRQVFLNHPNVDTRYFSCQGRETKALGDAVGAENSSRTGRMHAIQAREAALTLTPSAMPRPEIRLSEYERQHAAAFIRVHTKSEQAFKPLCILHAWSRQRSRGVAPVQLWDELVSANADRFRFWQVGLLNDSAIQGCDYYFLPPPKKMRAVRDLFAILSQAQAFIGMNAAPMHIARAFEIPSLILVDPSEPRDQEQATTELYSDVPRISAGRESWPTNRDHVLQGVAHFLGSIRRSDDAAKAAQPRAVTSATAAKSAPKISSLKLS